MTVTQRVLAEKRGIFVPLALFVVLNIVLYAVVVFPLGRQVKAAEADASAQHQELNAARLEPRCREPTSPARGQWS